MRKVVEERLGGGGSLDLYRLRGCLPTRIEELGEVVQGEALRAVATTGEMEDDGRLHGGEQRIAGSGDAVVEEVGLIDAPVLALRRRLADDTAQSVSNHSTLTAAWDAYRSTMSISAQSVSCVASGAGVGRTSNNIIESNDFRV